MRKCRTCNDEAAIRADERRKVTDKCLAPVHTRFDMLEWFVWDAEHPLSDLNQAEVIRQAETLEEALRGL